jgi:hypothetical protein
LTLFANERAFDSFFGVTAGFFASGFGEAVGEGDGVGATVGLGLAATIASVARAALRDLTASVIPIKSTAATTAAITLSCLFDFSVPLTNTEILGKERCFTVTTAGPELFPSLPLAN